MSEHETDLSIDTEDGGVMSNLDIPGQTILSDTVLETIAGIATREVEGVYMLGKGALRNVIGKVTGTSDTTQGVSAEVGKKEVAIDLEMIVEYGFNIKDVAAKVRKLVAERIHQMTGLRIKEINIKVHDIHYKLPETVVKSPRVE